MSVQFSLSLLLLLLLEAAQLANGNRSLAEKPTMRILALFSGSSNDLGIDHRLGRQVLKLAIERARRLHANELADIELIMQVDQVECNDLNSLPNQVTEQIYKEFREADCGDNNAVCRSDSDQETRDISLFLNQTGVRRRRRQIPGANNSTASSWAHQIDAIIGPSCDYLVDLIARMAAYWRKPIYTVTSVGAAFARKDIYSTLTRLSPSIDHLSMFLMKLLEKFEWRHLAIIVDKTQIENRIILENIEKTAAGLRYRTSIEHKVFPYTEMPTPNASETEGSKEASLCTREARETLLAGKRVARVFLLLISDHQQVRRLLLCAHELEMYNGEFSFIAFNLGLKSASKQHASLDSTLEQAPTSSGEPPSRPKASARQQEQISMNIEWYSADDEANNLIARQIYESLMVLSVQLPTGDELSLFVEQTLDMAHQEYPNVRFERSDVGAVAIAMHDSLLLAAEAFVRQISTEKGASFHSMSQLESLSSEYSVMATQENDTSSASVVDSGRARIKVPSMWNERYPHGLIKNLYINANGDQELDYVLSDLEPEMGLMRPVASYAKDTRQVQLLPNSYIHWPPRLGTTTSTGEQGTADSDRPPPDEPECGFTGEAEQCVDRQNLYAALMVVSVLAGLIAVIATISLRRYHEIKHQMQLDDYWWRISWNDLHFVQANGSLTSNSQIVVRALRPASGVGAPSGSLVSAGSDAFRIAKRRKLPRHTSVSQVGSDESNFRKTKQVRRAAVPVIITSECASSVVKQSRSIVGESVLDGQTSGEEGSRISSLLENSCLIRSEFSVVVKSSLLAMYKDALVVVKQLNATTIEVTRELLVELRSIRELVNDNLAKFVGLCIEPGRLSIIYEYYSRGSLQDMLLNESISMDWALKYSIIGDLLNGLNFIHTTLLDYHGRLKSTNLVLDSRFTVKIIDFGLQNLYSQVDAIEGRSQDYDSDGNDDEGGPDEGDDHPTKPRSTMDRKLSVSQATCNMDSVSVRAEKCRHESSSLNRLASTRLKNRGAARYYWTAPEHLRERNPHSVGSKKGDIYSVAIILAELVTRKEPYHYGTNAKPNWTAIRNQRTVLQEQQDKHTPSHRGTESQYSLRRHGGALHGSEAGTGSVVSQQARRSKRNSIRPAPAEGVANPVRDSTSVVSAKEEPHRRNNPSSGDKIALESSVAAIEERAEINELEMLEMADHVPSPGAVAGGKSPMASALAPPAGPEKSQDPEEILDQLRMGIQPEPVRPYLPNYVLVDTNAKFIELMRSCWAEAPALRPTVVQIKQQLRKMTHGAAGKNYLDSLLSRLQTYAANLEEIVDSKSADIVEEKQRTEELLYQLVPKFVADRLKRNEPIIPQVFDGVTIFFSDIVGFEKYASVMSPGELVDLLNSTYSSFDSIISSFDVTKIEVILDQFLVAAGISLEQNEVARDDAKQPIDTNDAKATGAPTKSFSQDTDGPVEADKGAAKKGRSPRIPFGKKNQSVEEKDAKAKPTGESVDSIDKQMNAGTVLNSVHYRRASAEQIARMALCIRDLVKSPHFRQTLSRAGESWSRQNSEGANIGGGSGSIVASTFNIRIGIHSGKVCAGIVGLKRPKFCLIGDTVNVASRMHTNSKANRIQISNDTRELLKLVPGFNIEPRGKIEVKGKGVMETYWLESSY